MKRQILTAVAAILLVGGDVDRGLPRSGQPTPADSAAAYDRNAGVPDKSAGAALLGRACRKPIARRHSWRRFGQRSQRGYARRRMISKFGVNHLRFR